MPAVLNIHRQEILMSKFLAGFCVLLVCLFSCVFVSGSVATETTTSGPSAQKEDKGFTEQTGSHANRSKMWQHSGNLLWGFDDMYQLKVLYVPEDRQYPFRAWFFGWAVKDCNTNVPDHNGCDSIFAARSKSLESGWEVYKGENAWDAKMDPSLWRPVLSADKNYFDEWHNGDPSVVKVGDHYFMAYSSTGFNKDGKLYGRPGDTDGSFQCIMGASSADGIHWRRSVRPILENSAAYGAPTRNPAGSAFAQQAGDVHMYADYARPSVLYEDGTFKIWFDYPTPAGLSAGYAENHGEFINPDDWKIPRGGKHPCRGLENFPNPDVTRIGKVYFAYADPGDYGSGWAGRKIAEAISTNGLDWLILGYVDPDPDTPAIHVPQAFVWRSEGQIWIYVFYACQLGGNPYNYRYDRIRFMRRKIEPAQLVYYESLCRKGYQN
jgi:hypothetical protein